MENLKRSEHSSSSSSKKSLKRKLDEDFEDDRLRIVSLSPEDAHQDIIREVRTQVEILGASFSSAEPDRAASKRAIHILSELAKNGNSNHLIYCSFALDLTVRYTCIHIFLRDSAFGL